MAYARLDVYLADGKIQTFLLNEERVTLGSAPDQMIRLEAQAIAPQHALIIHAGKQASITDLGSEGGTLIDGQRLSPHKAYPLEEVEELQLGQFRAVFMLLDGSTTASNHPIEDTQQVVRGEISLAVALDKNQVSVWPASSSSCEVGIHNQGDEELLIGVRLMGFPSDWVRINRPELLISPGETAYVLVNFKPPRHPDVKPMRYNATIQVTPHDSPDAALFLPIEVRVRPYNGFGIALNQSLIESGETLFVYLHNQGSGDLPVQLVGVDKQNLLDIRFSMPRLTLGAGQRAQVAVYASPKKRPLWGKAQVVPFTIEAHQQEQARLIAPLPARIELEPRFKSWQLSTLGALLLALLLGLVWSLTGGLSSPQPAISNLSADKAVLREGENITLFWEAQGIERYNIVGNGGVLLATVRDGRTQASFPIENLSGDVLLSVEGLRGTTTVAQASIAVRVARPLGEAVISTDPAQLVNHVITALNIAWDFPNAVQVEITGLEGFAANIPGSGYNPAARYEASGALSVVSYATTGVNLAFRVTDELGQIFEFPYPIGSVPAVCTAQAAAPLRQGADAAWPLVGQVATGETVRVIAQDQFGQWLHVQDAERDGWAERNAFACSTSFSIEALRQEVSLLPTPAPANPTPPANTPTNTRPASPTPPR